MFHCPSGVSLPKRYKAAPTPGIGSSHVLDTWPRGRRCPPRTGLGRGSGCLCGRMHLGSGLASPKAHRSGLHPLSFLGAEPTSGQAGCQHRARQGWSLWGVAGAEGGEHEHLGGVLSQRISGRGTWVNVNPGALMDEFQVSWPCSSQPWSGQQGWMRPAESKAAFHCGGGANPAEPSGSTPRWGGWKEGSTLQSARP